MIEQLDIETEVDRQLRFGRRMRCEMVERLRCEAAAGEGVRADYWHRGSRVSAQQIKAFLSTPGSYGDKRLESQYKWRGEGLAPRKTFERVRESLVMYISVRIH